MKWIPMYYDVSKEDLTLLLHGLCGIEVLAYHKNWVCEDFNPTGVRVGYFQENGDDTYNFFSAEWDATQDTWYDKVDYMPAFICMKENPEIEFRKLHNAHKNLPIMEVSQEVLDFVSTNGHVLYFDLDTNHPGTIYSVNGTDWFKVKVKENA